MIFVTVGAQMPFDRMVQTVDRWAGERDRKDVFAQIGSTDWRPRHLEWTHSLDPSDFRERVSHAAALVAHAGMGSILTALDLGVPLLVMPRRADLRETRNDHQVATARRFRELGKLEVAFDADELFASLDRVEELGASERISPHASPELLDALRRFIHTAPARRGTSGT